ncbi:MAG: hypothetical protein JXX14_02410 [Deltaproteobacteria bacterium]|nr:hypothetical protein [Deltaproteobacteria bacterium]
MKYKIFIFSISLTAFLLSNSCNNSDEAPAASNRIEGDVVEECIDDADNDQDGLFDCNDPDCGGNPLCNGVETDSTMSTGQPSDSSSTLTISTDSGSGTTTVCKATQTPTETFTEMDKPDTFDVEGYSRSVSTPWGYNKPENADRIYPFVVNGCWGEGPLFPENIRKKYPAFYLAYQQCDNDEQGATLSVMIDVLLSQGHRIDLNRIYLTGWSQGGSGSYKLVRGLLSKGRLFSAIIRIAGQSETVIPDEAVAQTSIWYHIGTDDSDARVTVARDAYDFLKSHNYNKTATESSESDSIAGYNRTTLTLTKGDVEIVKYSVYDGMGHTPDPPYQDSNLFDWLFAQSLICRPI